MKYQVFTSLDIKSTLYKSMCQLHEQIFKTQSSHSIEEELSRRKKILLLLAIIDTKVIGYKVGYEDRKHRFYSWLGGVDSDFRGQGIASTLMEMQHKWCEEHGYTVIRTQTMNKWRNMLILNLQHGFDVVGTYTDDKGEPKIILEKRLLRE